MTTTSVDHVTVQDRDGMQILTCWRCGRSMGIPEMTVDNPRRFVLGFIEAFLDRHRGCQDTNPRKGPEHDPPQAA